MEIHNNIAFFRPSKPTVVTLGTFDGVHIGHRKIVDRLVNHARELDCESVILTFSPHPRMVLQQDSDLKLLNTIDEKAFLLSEAGLDNLVIHPFDKAFSQMDAEDFVSEILVDGLRVRKIIIGYDHRFGKNRTASITDLTAFGLQYGFEVEQIPAETIDAVSVSSTKIRAALASGNISLANTALGYHYFMSGTVIHGKKLGRTIGFPTANLSPLDPGKLIPADGVYLIQADLGDSVYHGLMNIGNRPTVNGSTPSTEAYLFDFDRDIYGRTMRISFLDRLRNEQKFESVQALQAQLQRDEIQGRNLLNR